MMARHFGLSSPRTVVTGESDQLAGSRGVTQYYADSIPLPAGSISRIEPTFERGKFSQALLDACALIFVSFFIVSGVLSLPLAIFLLLFANF